MLGFILLAVLVFLGFISAFHIVPADFEAQARKQTLARLEQSGTTVDESYIEASIEDAVRSNLHTVFRTTLIAALAVGIIICSLSMRPPHDCGGFNLFNPLAIPLIALIILSLGTALSLVLDAVPGQGVAEFRQVIASIEEGCAYDGDRLLLFAVAPLLIEVIFRGYVLSFLEKLHFSAAIVLSTLMYALCAYFCISKYAVWSVGSAACGWTAFCAAAATGFVFAVMTWRLRSCIPAVVSHVLLANSAPAVGALRTWVSLPAAIIVLAVSLALLVFLPLLLARRLPIFAYDYPFTRQHRHMERVLAGKPAAAKAAQDDGGAEESDAKQQKPLRLWPFIKRGIPDGDEKTEGESGSEASPSDEAEPPDEAEPIKPEETDG